MTASVPDVTARLDEINRLRAAATDYASLATDEAAKAFEQARYELAHIAVPELVAALRAVLARLDFADGTGRGVYGRSGGGAVWARDIRAAIAAALAGCPDPQPDQGSTGATT